MSSDEFDPYQQWLGIPPTVRPIDYYTLLGVERFCADAQRIEEAAEQRMRLLRRFQTGPRGLYTQKLLTEIAQARLRLLDPAKKEEYDRRLRASAQAAAELAAADESIELPPVAVGPSTVPVVGPPSLPISPWTSPGGIPSEQPPLAPPAPVAWPGGPLPVPGTGMGAGPGPRPSAVPAAPAAAAVPPPSRLLVRPAAGRSVRSPRVPWLGYLWLTSVTLLTIAVAVGLWLAFQHDRWHRRSSEGPVEKGAMPHTPAENADTSVVQPDATGTVHLLPSAALVVKNEQTFPHPGSGPIVLTQQEAAASWKWTLSVPQPTVYVLECTYVIEGDPRDARWEITIDDGARTSWHVGAVEDTSQPQTTSKIVYVRSNGVHQLSLRIHGLPPGTTVRLHALQLRPKRLSVGR